MSQGKPSQNQRTLTFRGVMAEAVAADRKAAGVASDLFKLAQGCDDLDHFLTQCGKEEDWVTSSEAGQMRMESVPQCWVQAKSDIKGAFKAGVDFNKVPTYSKMKARKIELNAASKATKENTDANDGAQPAQPETADRNPKHSEGKDAPDAKADNSLAEALASGAVVDAKSTLLVPDQLRELVALLGKLDNASELRAAQRIKEFTKTVKDDLSLIGMERNKGARSNAA